MSLKSAMIRKCTMWGVNLEDSDELEYLCIKASLQT